MASASDASPATEIAQDSRFKLGDGNTMPCIGFGTYQIKDADCQAPVEAALRLGYRHIDTAEFYANEKAIGKARGIYLNSNIHWHPVRGM